MKRGGLRLDGEEVECIFPTEANFVGSLGGFPRRSALYHRQETSAWYYALVSILTLTPRLLFSTGSSVVLEVVP